MPNSLKKYSSAGLDNLIKKTTEMLKSCCICPRRCRVNRLKNEKGFCKTGLKARVYNFMPHHGEEPPLSGKNGSGTIFFSGCNMRCVYCQNHEFSQAETTAKEVEPEELADFMLRLQNTGCHNINLVTPTHVMPQILASLKIAKDKGLKVPIVYNTGGHELAEIIKLLEGIIDIYLPDMRYADNKIAAMYSSTEDYAHYNHSAVKEMHRQTGKAEFTESGIITRGLIIRHLVLPNGMSGTAEIMEFISKTLSKETYVSLMGQYLPAWRAAEFNGLSRRITYQEYKEAKEIMEKYGLYNGWVQESGGLERFAGTNIKPAF